MSFLSMQTELKGSVAKFPISFAPTIINRAWRQIREDNLWSFNFFESAWVSPPLINAGTATVVQGLPTITVDPIAAAAINAGSTLYSFVTQRQFRIGISGIYNIIAWDGVNTLTLDRPYLDVSFTNAAYQIYQAYYPAPMQDLLTLISVRNMSLFLPLGLTRNREWADARDPQRSWYLYPTEVIPIGYDQRGSGTSNASATLGFPMFELWGQAQTPYTYQIAGLRRGTDLVNFTDTLPLPVGEDLVLALAKYYVYEWAEGNKDYQPRSSGPDWRFLMAAAMDEKKKLLIKYRRQDKEFFDAWTTKYGLLAANVQHSYYNSIGGYAGTHSPGY
jgi:hypothetical protein